MCVCVCVCLCVCVCVCMGRSSQENVVYEFVLTFPGLSSMYCLSYLDILADGMKLAVPVLFC